MRKRGEWPSAERSDTRGCGSRIAPTGASEARSRYSGDAASRREWRAKDAGASPCGTVAKPRALSTRRTRPEVSRAALFWAASRAEPSRVRRLRQDSPPTAYMYTPSGAKDAGIGRSRKASTVARNKAAHWKANQHTANTHRASGGVRHKCGACGIIYPIQWQWESQSPSSRR